MLTSPASLPRKLPLGNGWRGWCSSGLGLLLYLENWELSLLTLALAVFWSLLAGIIIKWRRILVRQRVLLLLRRGMVSEALALWGEPEPGSLVWWRHLIALFKAGDWREATRRLEAVEAGKERDYLLAAAYLGQNLPVRALALCPPKPQGKWRLLKAQAYFQLGEWKKVLGVLRGGGRLDENQALEWAWLKGASYYFLEQYKPPSSSWARWRRRSRRRMPGRKPGCEMPLPSWIRRNEDEEGCPFADPCAPGGRVHCRHRCPCFQEIAYLLGGQGGQ